MALIDYLVYGPASEGATEGREQQQQQLVCGWEESIK